MSQKTTILIIDDDTVLLGLLRQALEKAGYAVETAANGLAGLQRAYEAHPDLVILDVMMPRMDGWEVCARLREVAAMPIIMLTAKDEERDKLRGFNLGIDDYVTKPFSFAELTARVAAVLHRSRLAQPRAQRRVHTSGDLVVDVDGLRVTKKGEQISLTPTEFRLLAALVENAGRVLTHEQLLDRVWGYDAAGDTGYVKRYIWYLRQKLEDDPNSPRYILTERGFGYSFRKD
jgi:two-component system, OmpR family, KDP operon response regulator KdpE